MWKGNRESEIAAERQGEIERNKGGERKRERKQINQKERSTQTDRTDRKTGINRL